MQPSCVHPVCYNNVCWPLHRNHSFSCERRLLVYGMDVGNNKSERGSQVNKLFSSCISVIGSTFDHAFHATCIRSKLFMQHMWIVYNRSFNCIIDNQTIGLDKKNSYASELALIFPNKSMGAYTCACVCVHTKMCKNTVLKPMSHIAHIHFLLLACTSCICYSFISTVIVIICIESTANAHSSLHKCTSLFSAGFLHVGIWM